MSDPMDNLINAYHDEQQEWERVHRLAKEAVDYANTLGIYAIPMKHDGRIYWLPRMPNGNDPDFFWLQNTMPTFIGFLSWADAVYELGKHLTERAE